MQHPSRHRSAHRALRSAPLLALFCAALAAGCEKEAPKEEPKPAAPAATAAAKPAATKPKAQQPQQPAPKKLEWDDPTVWKRVPPTSAMRAASYLVPPVGGDKVVAELNVFVLGGDVESNIQRWVEEFSGYDPKTLYRADRVVNDMTEAVVEIPRGTYSGGMGEGGASDNYGLIGGIVVTPEDSKYFFKLTGPANTVNSARAPFYALLDSVRLEGGAAAPTSAKTVKTVGTAPADVKPGDAKPAPATAKPSTGPAKPSTGAAKPAAAPTQPAGASAPPAKP